MDLSLVRVPWQSVTIMGSSALLCLSIPTIGIIIWSKRTKTRIIDALIGAGAFIVFALILESMFNSIVVKATGNLITGNIWTYALYGGLAAGIFEETARLIAMKFLIKDKLTKASSIMYGFGHGGVEAIIIGTVSMLSNISLALVLNTGMGNVITESVPAELLDETVAQMSPLWTTPSWMFALSPIERISAILLHISLSYLVYRAVSEGKYLRYALAILIHAAFDMISAVLAGSGVSVLVIELVLLVFGVGAIMVTVKTYEKENSRT